MIFVLRFVLHLVVFQNVSHLYLFQNVSITDALKQFEKEHKVADHLILLAELL
jgi:hypothetical protein